MSLTLDIALTQAGYNQHTGRYGFSVGSGPGGDVQFDSTAAYAVMNSVACVRGGYWADATHGSDLATLRTLSTRTPSQAVAMTLDAVAPLEQLNLILNPQATAAKTGAVGILNALGVDLYWQTPGGAQQQVPNSIQI